MRADHLCPDESPYFSSVFPLSLFSWFLGEWAAHTWAKRCKSYLTLALVLLPPAFTGETAVPQKGTSLCPEGNMEDLCPSQQLKLLGFLW